MGGYSLQTNSTAHAIVQVQGPTLTYSVLKFKPIINSREFSFEVDGFTIRRDGEEYRLADVPISRLLSSSAYDDILYHTFEADDDARSSYHEIDFDITDFDEMIRIHFRCVEHQDYPEVLFYEVEDSGGDWLPVEDVLFSEMMTDAFLQTLEMSAIQKLNSHTLSYLPLAAE